MKFNYKTKPYKHQEVALEKTMPISWRWVVVNQKY